MEDYNTNSQAEPSAESKPDSAALQPETNLIEDRRPEKSWYKQPGSIAALLMILAAMVLLTAWLTGKPGEETAAPMPGAAALNAPLLTFETDIPTPTATLQPTAQPTAQQARTEVITYVIQEGDSIFSIASKFNLAPETILWSNRYELGDDPSVYTPGVSIYILPVDGVYHIWQQGEGLNGVSEFYGVTPDVIIDYPGNKLDRATLGNLSLPNIAPGTRLVVPGGTRPETVSADSLLTYAALTQIEKIPVGDPSTYPAPRKEIIAYVVQPQDTLFTIADKFGLTPET
ncbi:MAG TPA: LysM peptidoglycan-binding domain-containing protein, partial [Anaerolineaceae bacterium]|nr:LysM peptidoglycan-binding domain-containing protein [Anaerolineaceae bacterium]